MEDYGGPPGHTCIYYTSELRRSDRKRGKVFAATETLGRGGRTKDRAREAAVGSAYEPLVGLTVGYGMVGLATTSTAGSLTSLTSTATAACNSLAALVAARASRRTATSGAARAATRCMVWARAVASTPSSRTTRAPTTAAAVAAPAAPREVARRRAPAILGPCPADDCLPTLHRYSSVRRHAPSPAARARVCQVSHDQFLIESTVDELWMCEGGKIQVGGRRAGSKLPVMHCWLVSNNSMVARESPHGGAPSFGWFVLDWGRRCSTARSTSTRRACAARRTKRTPPSSRPGLKGASCWS